ncbi:Mu-like prophage major head subunit gpT family protein [Pseudoalteromonas sp. MMG013]|uniref:Mu-like prophage major head subunit gpT family protein n=1 Tax=unclassified Pseudoalteromonas TaxID=194690 RepID=UPI001B370E4D|nr:MULTISPECIES: Mu-like prophage major head subunit gpT family protein [unclassified Pseudoalteromonas]MBQ4852705.1 Mu-like prophage major head subunit gpT family protein [Pseudoalteromonas sp. MMG012]MBQ4860511.1 Mu-like prophage major head subunit gpT family protein [Pseudoalteromonas sp. MMG013]
MDITADVVRSIYTGVQTSFQQGRALYTPTWSNIATEVSSTTATEDYGWMGEFSKLREWIGDREVNKMELHTYSLRNKKFEGTEGISKDYIEDNRLGGVFKKFEDMGYAASSHPDELVYECLANGTKNLCYDGQPFFDAEHPMGDGNNKTLVSNIQDGSGVPWYLMDARRPLKPLIFQKRRDYKLTAKTDDGTSDRVFMADEYLYGVDARVNAGYGFWQQAFMSKAELTADNFNAAFKQMRQLKSDKGRPLGIKPNLLVVGAEHLAAANQLIKAMQKAGGASNTNYNQVQVLDSEWLD